MPDSNPYDMDLDGDVDSIDFLGFEYFMRYGPGRQGGPAQDRDGTSLELGSLIGLVVLAGTGVFGCLMCISERRRDTEAGLEDPAGAIQAKDVAGLMIDKPNSERSVP